MTGKTSYDIITIGGSAGSLPIIMDMLDALPQDFPIPIIIVVHRLKNVQSEMSELISAKRVIREPEDKEPIQSHHIYLAPQNYHLLVEDDKTISLDYSEPINYSRPSIDVSFISIGQVYKQNAVAILLTGANHDGAEGLQHIIEYGGLAIVQDPATAEYPVMPEAAIKKNKKIEILKPELIVDRLVSLV